MEENKRHRIIILGLNQMNHEEFMEALYNLMVSQPDEILNYEEKSEYKIERLNSLLRFFEEREEFEKCAKIKDIQELIKITKNEK